mgnify:CR=1 FL=1
MIRKRLFISVHSTDDEMSLGCYFIFIFVFHKSPFPPRTLLNSTPVLTPQVNEGTYGIVYRATDTRTGKIVALKKIKLKKEQEGWPEFCTLATELILVSQGFPIILLFIACRFPQTPPFVLLFEILCVTRMFNQQS